MATAGHTHGTARPSSRRDPQEPSTEMCIARTLLESCPLLQLWTPPLRTPHASACRKESGSRFAKAFKHPSAISTLAHPPAFVRTAWKGSWLLRKTAPFHSKIQRASGVHFGTTKLVCALEGQAELSHLTSCTPQTIHFQSVSLHYT